MAINKSPQIKDVGTKLRIVIRPQTPVEEFKYLKDVLSKLPWYEKNGYTVGLPENPLLRQQLKPEEFEDKFKLFSENEYDSDFFKNGVKVLEENRWRIEKPADAFLHLNKVWGFKVFPEYNITLTKYGPGGTYNEKTGQIIMLTTKQGTFRRAHPSHTAVHEMVHMGIEERIVRRFRLSHEEKERTVDLITYTLFGDFLPNYTLQKRGDTKIDPYVTLETLDNLPASIEHFVAKYPRKSIFIPT